MTGEFSSEEAARVNLREYVPYYLDNLAARHALSGKPETAEVLFRRALDLAPDSARIHYNFGMFQRLFGSEELGEALMEGAHDLGWPQDPSSRSEGLSLLD